MPIERFRGIEEMPPLPRASDADLARRIRAVWRRSRLFAGRPRNWRGVRRFRTIEEAGTARERTSGGPGRASRVLTGVELALIEALLPPASERSAVVAQLREARVYDDPSQHGTLNVHSVSPLFSERLLCTRKGLDPTGSEVELDFFAVLPTGFQFSCRRVDRKPFGGYPSPESLGPLLVETRGPFPTGR